MLAGQGEIHYNLIIHVYTQQSIYFDHLRKVHN